MSTSDPRVQKSADSSRFAPDSYAQSDVQKKTTLNTDRYEERSSSHTEGTRTRSRCCAVRLGERSVDGCFVKKCQRELEIEDRRESHNRE